MFLVDGLVRTQFTDIWNNNLRRKIVNNLGEQMNPPHYQGSRPNFGELRRTAEEEIFENCSSSGCVYEIGSYYSQWLLQANAFNRTIHLGYGINLQGLPMPNANKTQAAFRVLMDEAASNKKTVGTAK